MKACPCTPAAVAHRAGPDTNSTFCDAAALRQRTNSSVTGWEDLRLMEVCSGADGIVLEIISRPRMTFLSSKMPHLTTLEVTVRNYSPNLS